MKRTILITILCLILYTISHAQTKKDTTQFDTTYAGYFVRLDLDSTSFKTIMDYISSQPIGNPQIQSIYTILIKNAKAIPLYARKPKIK